MSEVVGKRVYPKEGEIGVWNPGEYGKDSSGRWFAFAPVENGGPLLINKPEYSWNIEEHEDGTISVTPSIRVMGGNGEPDIWHGHLTRGVWISC